MDSHKQANNLEYVKQILQLSPGPNSYPSIYFLWGCIVFAGFVISEYRLEWIQLYWFTAAPIGMFISAWLGVRGDKQNGQIDASLGKQYVAHFSILLAFIFIAILTKQYNSILLLIGLAYCLAGLYLEKLMWIVGLMCAAMSLLLHLGLINNQLWLGLIFALCFFTTAWLAARSNSRLIKNAD